MTDPVVIRFQGLVEECSFPGYTFTVTKDGRGTIYLQGTYEEADIISGDMETQSTRRWLLSPFMTKSEIIQTVFKCCMTSYEHRCREHFLYRGKRVFGPHFDVDALWSICGKVDVR